MDNRVRGIYRAPMWPGGELYTYQYTWDEHAALEAEFGVGGIPPFDKLDNLAKVAAIGLRRHHPELTPEKIFEMSPPVVLLQATVTMALKISFFGGEKSPFIDGPDTAKKKTLGQKVFQAFTFMRSKQA